ncbi:MAG: ABC transporter substrate-binding protein [Rhodospirillales bacterium]|nr:ABC transporter substrate-binding protein [Rhodospirillales bacterium]
MTRRLLGLVLGATIASGLAAAAEPKTHVSHAIAMHGEPKYGPGFTHFDYADPKAPRGGEIRLNAIGTFDTFNPFVLRGVAAAGISGLFETLTTGSQDEAFSRYGLLAESMEWPDDRSWITFTLRREARWHDVKPVTPEDVIFSLEILKTKGRPLYRGYYANVDRAEKVGERGVKFHFSGGENRELPLIIGELPILPKHYWEGRDFERATLDPPIGSGPYRVKSFEAGRTITFERVKDYWGAKLPVNVGSDNFDLMRYDYYRDGTVALEAFKSGEYDFRAENAAKDWATGYDSPALRHGLYKMEEIRHEIPTGLQGFAYNIRRPLFTDRRVRAALAFAFNFEWSNKNLFYGQYTQTRSYFSNSELASRGLPSPAELKILEPFRGKIPDEVFTKEYLPPKGDAEGNIRDELRQAFELLRQAGWAVKGGQLINDKSGQPFEFEILLNSPAFERIALPFVANLERLGIKARVRTVDAAQYQARVDDFDFDMTVEVFGQSLSPGNEQRDFCGSAAAQTKGSRNTIGIADPVVDALVDLVIAATDRDDLIARTRALDRVLLWGHYVIPNWHSRSFRVAYWDKLGKPSTTPKYGFCLQCWWVDPAKNAELEAKKAKR